MLFEGKHIKEVFAISMAVATDEILDEVAYFALKETDEHLQLYTCMPNAETNGFNQGLQERTDHNTKTKTTLRRYLHARLPDIVKLLDLTLVTDIDDDHLLTVKRNNAYFVYFGGMTKEYIHVVCWLRVPRQDNKIVFDLSTKPQIFFWLLHSSYAQELEALGAFEGLDMLSFKKQLDLKEGIEYT